MADFVMKMGMGNKLYLRPITYDDLPTTAKIICLEEYISIICPYDWDDFNETCTVADMEENVRLFIEQSNEHHDYLAIDLTGHWIDMDKDEYLYKAGGGTN